MKTAIFPVTVLAGFLAACGSDYGAGFCEQFPDDALCQEDTTQTGGNVCEQALQIAYAAFDTACAGINDCCFCQCWTSGHQQPDQFDPCSCKPMDPGGPCEGETKAQAEQCLADTTTCQQQLIDTVINICAY